MSVWATPTRLRRIPRRVVVSTRVARAHWRNARQRCPTTSARTAAWSSVCWRFRVSASASPLFPARQIEARHVVRKALEIQLLRKCDIADVAEQRYEIDTFGGEADRLAEGLATLFRIDAGPGLFQQLLHIGIARVVVYPAAEPIGHERRGIVDRIAAPTARIQRRLARFRQLDGGADLQLLDPHVDADGLEIVLHGSAALRCCIGHEFGIEAVGIAGLG